MKRPGERIVEYDVAQEKFPLNFEGVVIDRIGRLGGPSVHVGDWTVLIGVPQAPGGGGVVLDCAVAKTCDGGAISSVYLESQQVVALYPDAPRGVKVADDSVLEFKGGVGGVIGCALVWLSVFVPAFGEMGSAKTGEGLDVSEEILDDVLPVAKHVDDNAAVVFLTVVPRGALELFEFPWEHPVAELSADGENFTEEAGVDEVCLLYTSDAADE